VSPGTIALIVVAASIVAWALFILSITILRQRRAAKASAETETVDREHPAATGPTGAETPAEKKEEPKVTVEKVPEKKLKPLTPAQLAVSRRQFLNRAWTASFTAFLGFFGMSTLSFLWPKLTGGFGTEISVGDAQDLMDEIGPPDYTPKFVAEGRFWLVAYEGEPGDIPVYIATGASEVGMQALYRKCVHLGCSVPHCSKSMLFECPCHGSKYRLTGEYYGGPAPRGLDRFPISVKGGKVVVDTGTVEVGPPRGTDTWQKFSEPVGPFCVPV
jgi:cytochrome b6-f complex iron-sulfur subunit